MLVQIKAFFVALYAAITRGLSSSWEYFSYTALKTVFLTRYYMIKNFCQYTILTGCKTKFVFGTSWLYYGLIWTMTPLSVLFAISSALIMTCLAPGKELAKKIWLEFRYQEEIQKRNHMTWKEKLLARVWKHTLGLAACARTMYKTRNLETFISETVKISSMMGFEASILDAIFSRFFKKEAEPKLAPFNGMVFDFPMLKVPEKENHGVEELVNKTLPLFGFGSSIFGTDLSKFNLGDYINKASQNSRSLKGLYNDVKELLDFLGITTNSELVSLHESAEDISKLKTELLWITTTLVARGSRFCDPVNMTRFSNFERNLHKIGDKLRKIQCKKLQNNSLFVEVNQLYLKSLDVAAQIENIREGNGVRFQPVGVSIVGESHIGKSTLYHKLEQEIKLRLEEYHGDMFRGAKNWKTWSMNMRDEFDTGYVGQEITYVDDAFSDSEHKDHLKWLAFISNEPALTNQAALHMKGAPYKSYLVVTTSNTIPEKSAKINNITALQNRFPICIYAEKVKEVPRDKYDETFSHLAFYKGSMQQIKDKTYIEREKGRGNSISFDQIVKDICDEMVRHHKVYNDLLSQKMAFELEFERHMMEDIPEEAVPSTSSDSFEMELEKLKEVEGPTIEDSWDLLIKLAGGFESGVAFFGLHVKLDLENRTREEQEMCIAATYDRYCLDTMWKQKDSQFRAYASTAMPIKLTTRDSYWHPLVGEFHAQHCRDMEDSEYREQFERINIPYTELVKSKNRLEQFKKYGTKIFKKASDFSERVKTKTTEIVEESFTRLEDTRNMLDYDSNSLFIKFANACGIPDNKLFVVENGAIRWKYDKKYVIGGTIIGIIFLCLLIRLIFRRKEKLEKIEHGRIYEGKAGKKKGAPARIKVIPLTVYQQANESPFQTIGDLSGNVQFEYWNLGNEQFSAEAEIPEFRLQNKKPNVSVNKRYDVRNKHNVHTTVHAQIKGMYEAHEYVKLINRIETYISKYKITSYGVEVRISTTGSIVHLELSVYILTTEMQICNADNGNLSRSGRNMLHSTFMCDVAGEEIGSDAPVREVVLDAEQHSSNDDFLSSLKERNIVTVYFENNPQREVGYGLASLNKIIVPAHYLKSGRTSFYFRRSGIETYGYAKVISSNVKRDIAIARIVNRESDEHFEMNNYPETFRDISKHFSDSERMLDVSKGTPVLTVLPRSNMISTGKIARIGTERLRVKERLVEQYAAVLNGMSTAGMVGDCGGPVLRNLNNKPPMILGIWVGLIRGMEEGLVGIVVKTDLLEESEQHANDNWQHLIAPGIPDDLPTGDEKKYIGIYRGLNSCCPQPSLKKWHKSPFADEFEELLAPGPLSPYDERITEKLPLNNKGVPSLLLNPCSEMCRTLPEPDQNIIDIIAHNLTKEYSSKLQIKETPKDFELWLEQAINGNSENIHVKHIKLSAASGLPWSSIGQLKSDFLHNDDGYVTLKNCELGTALKNRIKLKYDQACKGERIISLVASKLKDDTIKLDFVKQGRTRVFHSVPVEKVIMDSGMFGNFKEAYTRAGLDLHHAIGVDVHSRAWGRIYAKLMEQDYQFDLDFKNYDKYLHRSVMEGVFRIINGCYISSEGKFYSKARQVLADECINTLVVDNRTIYKTNRGNKSGEFLTTIVNCIANDIYSYYCWIKTTGLTSLAKFRQEVNLVSFGDDKIESVSRNYVNKYNYFSCKKILEGIGHTITPGSKDGIERAWMEPSQLQFLKRSFHKMDSGIISAPLLQRSLESPFIWTQILDEEVDIWDDLIRNTLIEAALHGRKYFYTFRDKLKKCKNKYLLDVIQITLAISYEDVLSEYFDRYGR